MSWEGRNEQVKMGCFSKGFSLGMVAAVTELSANDERGSKGDVPGVGWNARVVSNAEVSGGGGQGGLDGEGREVALVDLECESDEDEEASVDESEGVDECLRSCGGRESVYTILRGALGNGTDVFVFVFKSAVDMRRVVGCMKEGVGSMSMGAS